MGHHIKAIDDPLWSENELELMYHGGNRKLELFLNKYDLNENRHFSRYSTNAVKFYKSSLKYMINNKRHDKVRPTYEQGRK